MARGQISLLAAHDSPGACSEFQRKAERAPERGTFPQPSCSQRTGWREMRDRHRAILSFPETKGKAVVRGKAARGRTLLNHGSRETAIRRVAPPSSALRGRNCG